MQSCTAGNISPPFMTPISSTRKHRTYTLRRILQRCHPQIYLGSILLLSSMPTSSAFLAKSSHQMNMLLGMRLRCHSSQRGSRLGLSLKIITMQQCLPSSNHLVRTNCSTCVYELTVETVPELSAEDRVELARAVNPDWSPYPSKEACTTILETCTGLT